MAPQWEYRVFKFKPNGIILRGGRIDTRMLSAELNAHGQAGWEVTGVFGSSIGEGATNEVAVILKRPVPQRTRSASSSDDAAGDGMLEGAAMERAASRAVLRARFKSTEVAGANAVAALLAEPGMWDQIMSAEAWDLAPTIFRAARRKEDTTNSARPVMVLSREVTTYVDALPHSLGVAALESAMMSTDSDVYTLLHIARHWELARYEFIRDVLRDGPVALRPRVLQFLSTTQRTIRPSDEDVLQEIAALVATPGRFASLKVKREEKGLFGMKTVVRCQTCQQEWPPADRSMFCDHCHRDEFGFASRDWKPSDAAARATGLAAAISELQGAEPSYSPQGVSQL